MARLHGQGFNKEKLIFIIGSFALALVGYYYITSQPLHLVVSDPLTRKQAPETMAVSDYGLSQGIDFYVTEKPLRSRKSPFTPEDFRKDQNPDEPIQPKLTPTPTNLVPPPPEQDKKTPTIGKETEKESKPTARDLQVTYMGLVIMGDDSYALLGRKDGSPPHRVKLNETIEDLNYKITKIEKQSVHLEDEEGNPYELKNEYFLGVDAGGKSSGGTNLTGGGHKRKEPSPGQKMDPGGKIQKTLEKTKATLDKLKADVENEKKEATKNIANPVKDHKANKEELKKKILDQRRKEKRSDTEGSNSDL